MRHLIDPAPAERSAMLPAAHRMRDGDSFRQAVRRGRRVGSPLLVVHVLDPRTGDTAPTGTPTLAGFVVSRAVGNAVIRNQVKRRLRHLLRPELAGVPAGSLVVVRALPAAAAAAPAELAADLVRCLSRATRRSAAA